MRNTHKFRGFTLVELLVVIAIIGMLVALLIPAVNAARARMRTAQCLNNMKQIATGIINYESTKQRLPGYVEPVKRSNGQYVGIVMNSSFRSIDQAGFENVQNPQQSTVAWSAIILPQIDSTGMWDILQDGNSLANQMVANQMEVYICPDDTDLKSVGGAAGLTYVVNTGAWDRNSSGKFLTGANVGDTVDNGLFHNLTLGGPKSQLTDARDGSSTTIMLSENFYKEPLNSWLGVDPTQGGEQQLGMVWVVANPPTGPPNAKCTSIYDQARVGIDPDVTTYPGDSPCFARPAGRHQGNVTNTAFVDGSARGLDYSGMEYITYQQLMSPWNDKCVNPEDHTDTRRDSVIYSFRKATPLADDDFK